MVKLFNQVNSVKIVTVAKKQIVAFVLANEKSSYMESKYYRKGGSYTLTHPSAFGLIQGNIWSVHTRAVQAERLSHAID